MAGGAKLQKSFQDYFRIPILLKPLGNSFLIINRQFQTLSQVIHYHKQQGNTSQQTINHITTIFNQTDTFLINQHGLSLQSAQSSISKQKIKKNPALYDRIVNDMKNRNQQESYKLLFLSDQFDNDFSQFQIIYRVNFVILIYSGQQVNKTQDNSELIRQHRKSDPAINNSADLNQKINKINIRLKQKDKKLLGIIFLNDKQQFSKSLIPSLKFTIVPPSLPLQQLSIFIEPWLVDLIPIIQQDIVQHILQCKYEENGIIVFNRSQDKSQPKIMKKKKKFRCLKICGDLSLMLHLYKFAYQSYIQADQQLRKVDDWMWVLGCIQGKLACMTSNGDLQIKESALQKQIEQLIEQSFIYSKKVKYQSFEVQNLFKILKLLLHEDKQRFDDMIENTLSTSKGLTEQQKFLYYSYIGSLYSKANMERKRNYYFYKASLIIQNFKPQISQLLLNTIKKSKYIKDWQELNSKIIQKIIQYEKYHNSNGQMYLELIQNCSNVLKQKQIQMIKDYLNYGNFQQKVIESNGQKLIEIKQFSILESLTKPKHNRLIVDQSPKKVNNSGIFVGWKKKITYLYQEDQPIIFKGTIVNKLPFQIRIKIHLQLQNHLSNSNNSNLTPQFSLILPPLLPYKFSKQISFSYRQELISIKRIKLQIWNFILYKNIQPQISFELYEKQPIFEMEVQNGQKVIVNIQNTQKQVIKIQMEQSSLFSLRCILRKINNIESDRLRISCAVYYDVDVGFQQNQFIFSSQNNFNNIPICLNNTIPNIKFIQSQQKESSIEYNQIDKILLLKLKQFKTSRNHIKKLQINLDYIKFKQSKYQLNKQYTIQPKIINSVWAQIVQISTPGLQQAIQNNKSNNSNQVKALKQNWNIIQNLFIVKIKFYKQNCNLRPFKVWYQEEQNIGKVLGNKQVILSNLTQGEICIELQKIKTTLKQKQQILNIQKELQNSQQQNNQTNLVNNQIMKSLQKLIKPLSFRWQNIVNKNMQGRINVKIKPQSLIFSPQLSISIYINPYSNPKQNNKQTQQQKERNINNYKMYNLAYVISSKQKQQIKPHKISVKPYSQITSFSQNNNQNLNQNNQSSTNFNILIEGKTKINKIHKLNSKLNHYLINQMRSNSENKNIKNIQNQNQQSKLKYYMNQLKLKIIKQKNHTSIQPDSSQQIKIAVTIQFDQKQIGKYQSIIILS